MFYFDSWQGKKKGKTILHAESLVVIKVAGASVLTLAGRRHGGWWIKP